MVLLTSYISEHKISDVQRSTNIVHIISEYVSLKKVGRNYVGLCPFHSEKTPSFTVNEEKQIFYCFGCGVGGNVFNFLMRYNNVSFPEAVRYLAERLGIDIAIGSLSATKKRQLEERERLFKINSLAAGHFRHVLLETPDGRQGREYLDRRSIMREVIERFGLGYAKRSWNDLVMFFSERGIPLDDVEKAGLIVPKEKGYFDRFRERIIFPIYNIHQQVIGFGGRVLAQGQGLPKYLNSPETLIYSKRRSLYGLNITKDECRRKDLAFIVEGYFDLLALFQHGIRYAVATLGTALTREHIRILKGYARKLILVFDSDVAGLKAAERSIKLFAEEDVDARILILPEGHDPDSYIFEVGAEGFLRRSEQSMSIMSFLMKSAIEKYGLSLEGKVRIIRSMKEPIASLPDVVSRSLHIRKLSEYLDIDESVITNEIEDARRGFERSQPALKDQDSLTFSKFESTLISMMLQFPEILPEIDVHGMVQTFQTELFRKIGMLVSSTLEEKGSVEIPELIDKAEDDETKASISRLSLEQREWSRKSCYKIISQYQAVVQKREHKMFVKKIKEAERQNDQRLLYQLLEGQKRVKEKIDFMRPSAR
nr:DNA primase [Desulfobacterales bacterium]